MVEEGEVWRDVGEEECVVGGKGVGTVRETQDNKGFMSRKEGICTGRNTF